MIIILYNIEEIDKVVFKIFEQFHIKFYLVHNQVANYSISITWTSRELVNWL